MARRVKRRYWDDGARVYLEEYHEEGRQSREESTPTRLKFWRDRGEGPFVYFIKCSDAGAVKIGIAKDPLHRVAVLQAGNPYLLSLNEVLVGDRDLEHYFHQRFDGWHIHGEWFGEADAIIAFARGHAEEQVKNFHEVGRVVPPWFGQVWRRTANDAERDWLWDGLRK